MIAASNVFLAIAVVSVLCGVVFAVMIGGALQGRGVKVNWLLFRVLLVSRYLGQYRDITRQERGRPGPLYNSYIIAMLVALVTAIVGLVLRGI
jgi:hypothetical protein